MQGPSGAGRGRPHARGGLGGGSAQQPHLSISSPIGPVRRSNGVDYTRARVPVAVGTIESRIATAATSSAQRPPTGPTIGNVDRVAQHVRTTESSSSIHFRRPGDRRQAPDVELPSERPQAKSSNQTTQLISLSDDTPTVNESSAAVEPVEVTAQHSEETQAGNRKDGNEDVGDLSRAVPATPTAPSQEFSLGLKNKFRRGDKRKSYGFVSQVETTTSNLGTKAYPLAPASKTRLPKSKTMAVFSNLTASLSRVSFSSSDRKFSTSSIASKASKTSNQSTINLVPEETSKHTSFSTVSDIVPADHPLVKHPGAIHTAQPSAYWTGRFTGLSDQLLSESRLCEESMQRIHESKQTSRPNRNNPVARPGIPTSHTTAALTTIAASPPPTYTSHVSVSNPISTAPKPALEKYGSIKGLDEDDARALAIFERLRSLCITREALESLWHWQQEYARKQRKSSLLPPGGSLSSLNVKMSGVLARFLSHNNHGARLFRSQAS